MEYPSESEIQSRLWPWKAVLWLAAIALPVAGFLLEFRGIVPDAFSRAGSSLVVIVVAVYFFLENKEFLTGNPANYMDSDNHAIPKKVLSTTYFLVSLIGSLASIFGDLFVNLFKCCGMKC